MCKRLALVISAIGGIASLGAHAATEERALLAFHASGQAVYTQIKASDESFSPSLFQFKAGVEFTDNLMDGIGIQAMLAVPISDAIENGMTLEITQQSGIYLTLTNPDAMSDDLKINILLGYASTEIETLLPSLGDQAKNADTFSGFSYGFSLQYRILQDIPFYWTLDFLRYYRDDNLRVDGLGLGVTYAF